MSAPFEQSFVLDFETSWDSKCSTRQAGLSKLTNEEYM